ncbi:MAG TPA: ABC transporter permease [Candidatus Eisenbacteria bacterium]|jgi:putative ABC transport system permease protein|nr:ABC transporter permease [Candidatus Eisenbacteria bacterium]
METFWQDLQFAARMMRKNFGFTVAAVLCLMLGIGATTGIFTVVNAVLLRPLPYAHPEQLLRVYTEFPTFPNGGLPRFWTSGPEFLELRRDTHSFSSLDAWAAGGINMGGKTQPVRLNGALVSGGLLNSLGVAPVMGRLLSESDDQPGAPKVADISYGTWRSAFGGDRDIIGRETQLDGKKCTIIGVMPKDFQFPPGEEDPAQVWAALQIDPANPGGRSSHNYYLIARTKPGVSTAQSQGELQSLVQYYDEHRTPKTHSFTLKNHTLVSYPLQSEVVSSVRPALLMLLGAVAFVLLIASVNVANLLLARAEARRREIAIRGALGAGVSRLARQFVTEGILLALCGAALGLALAYGGVRLVQITNAGGIPRADEIVMDARVLVFTLVTSLVTGALFGLAPLIPLLISGISGSLKDTAGGTTGTGGAQLFRRTLVVGELAMALVLLIGCGLMLRAFWRLQAVHTGLSADNVMTMRISLPSGTYSDNAKLENFWSRLDERIAHLPAAQSTALVSGLPPLRPPNMNDTSIEGFVKREGGPIENVDFYQAVSKDYFTTLGIRLMDGRFFDDRDAKGANSVVIVNKSMANTFWPNQNPIGRRIKTYGDKPQDPWVTVVGVVDDAKNAGLDRPAGTELYLPYAQAETLSISDMYVVSRARNGDSRQLVGSIRQQVNDLDASLPIADIRTMDDVLERAQARPRFLTLLLSLFSIVALAIATVGIYGVVSYSVARRTKEFGLRMVLGAQGGDVLGLVMKQGVGMVMIGLAAGLLTAFGLTRLMASLLFGVAPTDATTFASVTAVLAAVALAACYIPARRATRVDPMQTLRYE